jgi:hypothetical protein
MSEPHASCKGSNKLLTSSSILLVKFLGIELSIPLFCAVFEY